MWLIAFKRQVVSNVLRKNIKITWIRWVIIVVYLSDLENSPVIPWPYFASLSVWHPFFLFGLFKLSSLTVKIFYFWNRDFNNWKIHPFCVRQTWEMFPLLSRPHFKRLFSDLLWLLFLPQFYTKYLLKDILFPQSILYGI